MGAMMLVVVHDFQHAETQLARGPSAAVPKGIAVEPALAGQRGRWWLRRSVAFGVSNVAARGCTGRRVRRHPPCG
eukprot:SAG31_NODE_3105_length_4668_cov_1.437733_5_plen_75_part_00